MTSRAWRVAILAALTTILLAEVGLRIIPRSLVPRLRILDRVYSARAAWNDMMSGDAYLGYKLKQGLSVEFPSEGRSIPYRTDSFGLGDIGFRDIGTKAPFDAVVIGGSFAVCDDVPPEACWVRKLSDSLGAPAATLAVNGYSTIAASRMLERYGMQLHPKLVLLEVHPNDFRDNLNFVHWEASHDPNLWSWLRRHHGRNGSNGWLSSHSMVYRLWDGMKRGYQKDIFPYSHDGLDLVFRFDSWFVTVVSGGAQHPGWPLLQQSILDVTRTAKAGGSAVMMVLFPTKEQTYWDLARSNAPTSVAANPDLPIDLVAGFCRANGIPYCDLRVPLRRAAQAPAQLFHRISTHMNDSGNAVTAAAVEQCLRDQQLVSQLGRGKMEGQVDGH